MQIAAVLGAYLPGIPGHEICFPGKVEGSFKVPDATWNRASQL